MVFVIDRRNFLKILGVSTLAFSVGCTKEEDKKGLSLAELNRFDIVMCGVNESSFVMMVRYNIKSSDEYEVIRLCVSENTFDEETVYVGNKNNFYKDYNVSSITPALLEFQEEFGYKEEYDIEEIKYIMNAFFEKNKETEKVKKLK